MQTLGYAILIFFAAAVAAVLISKKKKPSKDRLERQKEEYEALLKKYQVPEEHYRIVIGQSRVYSVYNCPAVIWREGDKIKTLVLRLNPAVSEQDEEEYVFLASQPYVDFYRFDGTGYPDWDRQSQYVKELFLPYVDLSSSKGGIDYQRQMYWVGTICLYPSSMAEVFHMLGWPLGKYENRVDNKGLMLTDGSLPETMQEELVKLMESNKESAIFLSGEEKKDSAALKDMEKAIQIIRKTERKAGEEAAANQINKLYAKLLAEKRYEDLERATGDEAYRDQLFRELE